VSQDGTQDTRAAELIQAGNAVIGIELGSTRIKATLIDDGYKPIASGSFGWENKLENGVWTYHMDDVWTGVASCFTDLQSDVEKRYGVTLSRAAAIGISGMMHGYIAVDKDDQLLAPFRTWRNNITEEAAEKLTELFHFAIPQRWSIAHLYQLMLHEEEHVSRVAHLSTLSAHVHYHLTGRRSIGICEASGMFPVDPDTQDYDRNMVEAFDKTAASHGMPWKLRNLLPEIVPAGAPAGALTEEGARLLDPAGHLEAGIPLAAPEGDAGTGMVATNSVRPRTGNASAGTSAFAMVVLEEKLADYHREIDVILTPDGKQVAMAHSNNCTSDFDAWMSVFGEVASALGLEASAEQLYGTLMPLALQSDADAGGVLTYPYVSGEHVTGFSEGRPMVVRSPDGNFTLANLIRAQLFSSLAALRTSLDILTGEENAEFDEIRGHGGFFKTPEVGQRILAAVTNSRVSVLDTAGEGGAWGMALLAAYTAARTGGGSAPGGGASAGAGTGAKDFASFLDDALADSKGIAVEPRPDDVEGFNRYFQRYTAGLAAERAAVDSLR